MNTNVRTNSIVNVNLNGVDAVEVVKDVKARLTAVERSAFNIALECAYALGVSIPAHIDSKGIEHGEATIDRPIKKQSELLKLIGRSKATLSRWIKAISLIIEHGYFTEFSSGTYPFSYDKIITIFENSEKFEGLVFSDLMGLTVDTLENMTGSIKEETSADTEEEDATKAEEAEEETATIMYNNVEYVVPRASFEKWLTKHMIANK